ncbi:uncharacterized protein LOC103733112 isoform X2 [Nannospalax galili]|uniref:uncharacterized protein LOC103733112 isoform X2 n=1 Tax=Nannospalax galili TaxID=1026970 RepID=UPI00111C0BA7|nr:uncharacterized protein LOC103733112 isoform X2 [Nannospalax galili]
MHLFFPQLQRQRAQESPTPPTTKEVLGSQRPLSVFLLNYLVAPLPLKVLFLRDGWAHPSLHLGAKPKRFPPRFSGLFCFFAREVTQVLREFCVQTHEMNFCPSEFEVISEMIFYSSWYRRTFCVISKAQVETKKLTLIKDAFDLRGKQLCAVWNSSPLVSSLSSNANLKPGVVSPPESGFQPFAQVIKSEKTEMNNLPRSLVTRVEKKLCKT